MHTGRTAPRSNLSVRQRRFAEHYAIENNGAAAARAAGYSRESAKVTASRLLQRVDVRAYITTLQTERLAGRNAGNGPVTREWVTEKYRAIANANLADYLTADRRGGFRWKDPDELTAAQRDAVAAVKLEPSRGKGGDGGLRVAGYKLYPARPALAALERLGGVQNKVTIEGRHADKFSGFAFEVPTEPVSRTSERRSGRKSHTAARGSS